MASYIKAIKKYFSLHLVLAVLTLSCQSIEAEAPPSDIIQPAEMTKILIDLHIAEAQTMNSNIRGLDTTQAFYENLTAKIYKQYKIDTALYNRSFRWYTQHPIQLDSIYVDIVDSLGLMESKGRWKDYLNQ
jgi:hypothetical protein